MISVCGCNLHWPHVFIINCPIRDAWFCCSARYLASVVFDWWSPENWTYCFYSIRSLLVVMHCFLCFFLNPHWVIFILIKQGRLQTSAAYSTCLEWASHRPLRKHYVTASLLPQESGSLDQQKALSALLGYTCDAPFRDVTDAQHYPEVWGQKK